MIKLLGKKQRSCPDTRLGLKSLDGHHVTPRKQNNNTGVKKIVLILMACQFAQIQLWQPN